MKTIKDQKLNQITGGAIPTPTSYCTKSGHEVQGEGKGLDRAVEAGGLKQCLITS